MGIIMNLRERKNKDEELRRRFNTVSKHMDVLSGFLETLQEKTQQNGCTLYGWKPGAKTDAGTQTEEPESQGIIEDAFYFLKKRPPLWSTFHVNKGYTTPGGTTISGELKKEFYALRTRYRDQQQTVAEGIPLRR
jgi:hypothetical protein